MSALIKYDQARQALAACRSVDEIKDIRDKSEAIRLYAKQAQDTELEQWAAEIKLRAQRAIGELSAQLETQKGGFGIVPTGGKHKAEVLADAGISTSAANRYEKLAAIPEPVIEQFIAKSKEAGKPVSVKAVMAQLVPKPAAAAPRTPAPATTADTEPDQLYDHAVEVVLAHRRASISLVQRHLCIGYNRAARLLEQMERAGVVSPMQSNGNRDILAPAEPGAPPSPSLVQQVLDQQAAPAPAVLDDEGSALNTDPADEDATGDDDGHQQLLDDYNAVVTQRDDLVTKVATLEVHIALLTRDDLAAQVDGLVQRADAAELKFDQLSGRNRQLQQTARDAQVTAQYQSDLLAKVRKALGVEANSDILPAISTRRAAA